MRLDKDKPSGTHRKNKMAQWNRLIHRRHKQINIYMFWPNSNHNVSSSVSKKIMADAYDNVVSSERRSLRSWGAVGRMRLNHDRRILTWRCENKGDFKCLQYSQIPYVSLQIIQHRAEWPKCENKKTSSRIVSHSRSVGPVRKWSRKHSRQKW